MSAAQQQIHADRQSDAPSDGTAGSPPVKSKGVISFLGLLAPVILTFLIYSNTFNSPFILDDLSVITGNRYIRISDLSAGSLLSSITDHASRPVPVVSFALNYYFGKYNPYGYHLVNICIHALTGILLLLFITYTAKISNLPQIEFPLVGTLPGPLLAILAACVWVAHPVNTQSVTYIVQRMNSLAALFSLLAILGYLKGRTTQPRRLKTMWFSGALFAWFLALGSKETAAILPFVALLYEWYFFQDLKRAWLQRNLKFFIGGGLLFVILALIYTGGDPIGKLSSLRDFSEARFTLTERALTQFRVVVHYLGLFGYPLPSRLNLDYDFALSHSLFDPVATVLSLGILGGLLITGVLTARRYRLISFCIFWFFLFLVIESSVIPLAIIFEHRTYMPYMGLAFLAVLMVDRFLKPIWPKIALLSFLIAVGALGTYQRNATYQDAITLWQDTATKSPGKARPHNNLGLALLADKQVREAVTHFKAALAIEPDQKDALNNLGLALAEQEQLSAATELFRTALKNHPRDKMTLNNLGSVLKQQGLPGEAIQYFQAALQVDPDYAEALNNLGAVYLDRNQNETAEKLFKSALRINPDSAELYNNLGAAMLAQGKTEQAKRHFEVALHIDPGFTAAGIHLGAVLRKQGHPDAAIRLLKDALDKHPDDIDVLNHLGLAYIAQGQATTALDMFERALKINPDNVEAHINAGAGALQLGHFAAAITHLEKALELAPEMAQVHLNLGVGLMQSGHFEKGIVHLEKALALEPENKSAQTNLHRARALKNEVESRIQELQAMLVASPNSPRLYAELADLHNSIGKPAAAIDALKQGLAIDPQSDALLNNLGNLYLAGGQYLSARKVFEQHLALDPSFSLPYYNLARWHARQGQRPEAIDWLAKAIARGYSNWEQVKFDPDLESIRGTSEYAVLMKGK